jgi:hypothetical protein
MNDQLRKKVYTRDGNACWHCGTTDGLSIQHRSNKGMGGSKHKDRLDNLLTFCLEANQRLEADATFANQGRDNGWKLASWIDYSSPVWSAWQKKWFVIDIDGNKKETEPPLYLI